MNPIHTMSIAVDTLLKSVFISEPGTFEKRHRFSVNKRFIGKWKIILDRHCNYKRNDVPRPFSRIMKMNVPNGSFWIRAYERSESLDCWKKDLSNEFDMSNDFILVANGKNEAMKK